MDRILIQGGRALNGEVHIAGAKNAALALMPAALLTDQPLSFTNVPNLSDIGTTNALLTSLGAEVKTRDALIIQAKNISNPVAHYDIVRKMRASVLVLGPMIARLGRARVSLPGGCAIGARPVDLHLKGLTALGAEITLNDGYIEARAGRLVGAKIALDFASVGATENIMMAASLAKGTTVLSNAAREPEIIDLAKLLSAMGARISGAGGDTITIEGVDTLHGAAHQVIVDRIELGTYMIAPLIAGGQVECLGGRRELLEAFCEKLEASGAQIEETSRGLTVSRASEQMKAVDVQTAPYPGFPTDLQAQMMAMLCTADGESCLEERVFENRFMHAPELQRMGAHIDVQGGTARVTGVTRLRAAPVMATDLRASVSLILAGLAAEGETVLSRVYHLDRGYENVAEKLSALGAIVKRTVNDER